MPSRPPRKKPGEAAAITGPAIVKAPTKLERIRRREAADAYAMRTRVASRSAGCRRCKGKLRGSAGNRKHGLLYIRPGSRLRVMGAAHRCLARRQTACVAWPKLRASRRREVS